MPAHPPGDPANNHSYYRSIGEEMKVIQLILFVVLAVEAFWLYVVNDNLLGILLTLPAGVMLYLLLRDRIQETRVK